jgi:hypothetical protein
MKFLRTTLKAVLAIWVALLLCLLAGVAGGLVIRGCNTVLTFPR